MSGGPKLPSCFSNACTVTVSRTSEEERSGENRTLKMSDSEKLRGMEDEFLK